MKEKKVWRKILYEKQDYADNYVDDSFLKDLKKNLHMKKYILTEAIQASTVVTIEISSVVLFALVYRSIETKKIKADSIFVGTSILTCLLYTLFSFAMRKNGKSDIIKDFKSTGFFLLFGCTLAPILKTLTDTISTDTIYAMSTCMFLLHLVSHDYGIDGAFVSSSLSLNSALFSAVCLASRLGSIEDAFVLLTFSVEVFTLFPIFRRQLPMHPSIWWAVVFTLILAASFGLSYISSVCVVIFSGLLLFLNIICPVWFVKWQKYKENLYGPWDEAVIKVLT
ncbi:hypothetical protein CHUAL_010816 [Chamberlinius hualienensis]